MSELRSVSFRSRLARDMSSSDGLNDLAAIVVASLRNNEAAGVTSALAVIGGSLLQTIEGPDRSVGNTIDRICLDPRHAQFEVIENATVARRRFAGNAMALVGQGKQARTLLQRWADAEPENAESLPEILAAMLEADRRSEFIEPSSATRPPDSDRLNRGSTLDASKLRAEIDAMSDRQRAGAPRPSIEQVPIEWQVLDAIHPTLLLDASGRILRANRRFALMLDHDASELAGRPIDDLVVQEIEAPRPSIVCASLTTKDATAEAIYRLMTKDGRKRRIEMRFVSASASCSAHLYVVLATDITEAANLADDERAQIAAIDASLAVIQFDCTGTILDANDHFLAITGYDLDEIRGQPHQIFVDSAYAAGQEYATFWSSLIAGKPQTAEFKRFGKNGRAIWLRASYHPVLDRGGSVTRIVEYAADVTVEREQQVDDRWQIAAIYKSHAVISFDMHGIILDANPAFLDAVGYKLEEIVGHHHRIFVDPSYAHSAEYAEFWSDLSRGRHQSGQYRRVGKDGRSIWLQASYNPIFDMSGRPFKIVKFATVVTAEKLRQAEQQGQIAAIHKAQCVIAFDINGTILDANTNFLDAVGYRLAEVRGKHHRMFVDTETAASDGYAAFWRELASGRHHTAAFRRFGKNGREIWLQASYNPIFDMNGRPFKVVKYATDITAEKLRQSDYEGQIAAIQKSQGVIAFSLDGTILDANAMVLDMLGFELIDIKGHHHRMLVDPGHAASAEYAEFWRTLREGRFASGLYKRFGKDGREIWIRATYNPILDPNGRPIKIIKFATDVTSDVRLAEAYEDAKRQAQHDAATALPNRSRLASFLASALAVPGTTVALLYVDLDHFKAINDSFGHQLGDRVLGEVADRFRRVLKNDQLVARIGGDEFVMVAPGASEEEVASFCQKLMSLMAEPIHHDGGEISLSISIGIAMAPTDGRTPDDLLRSADIALYRSKQNGRGQFAFFAADMNDRIFAYRSLVDDMRRGLACNEFFVEYQPRFDTRTQTMRSVEALVRWNHPVHGRISPVDFIPLAERSGLINELGTWVLRTACKTAAEWGEVGVSVNVSPVQFRSEALVDLIIEALDMAGLDPHRLELEITEGVLLEDAARALTALASLKKLGVKLAIDDFGTGYSSLSSLRTFPFDVIKIDRQFISDMNAREGGREVVRAVLALGRALDLSVTAEGVETSEQLDMLAADQCDEVQGYHLARPMAPEQISMALVNRRGGGPGGTPKELRELRVA